MEGNESTKIDLRYSDNLVVFRVSDCCLNKNYSLSVLNRTEAELLIKKLNEKEKYTWKQLSALQRDSGLTVEKRNSESYVMIDSENNSPSKFTDEKYYFHLRVEQKGLFRIFGYQWKESFYITHVDTKGKIHHS